MREDGANSRGGGFCARMAAYAKPGTLLYRDLSLAEHPYSLHSLGPWSPSVLAARRGPAAWPLRVTGDPKVDAHTRTRDVLQRSAAGGALLGQTLDLLLDGGCAQRCHIINSRYAHTGELEYLLQPLGDEATVVGALSLVKTPAASSAMACPSAVAHACSCMES